MIDIEAEKKNIDGMSRMEMARLWRFAPSGHLYFRKDRDLFEYFENRFFKVLGGFSPEISKAIGWGD